MITRIKVCGITRVEDAKQAARLGVDAIGLVFYEASPRCVGLRQAIEIKRALPPFVSVVSLFVNEKRARVDEILRALRPECLQFHGDEDASDCEQYDHAYIKAVRVREISDVLSAAHQHTRAQALLLDTWDDKLWGGSGKVFDWSLVPSEVSMPMVLAGGLTAQNVCAAIKSVKPYAVDVSGGVELSKGIKSAEKIRLFVDEVRRCHAGASTSKGTC